MITEQTQRCPLHHFPPPLLLSLPPRRPQLRLLPHMDTVLSPYTTLTTHPSGKRPLRLRNIPRQHPRPGGALCLRANAVLSYAPLYDLLRRLRPFQDETPFVPALSPLLSLPQSTKYGHLDQSLLLQSPPQCGRPPPLMLTTASTYKHGRRSPTHLSRIGRHDITLLRSLLPLILSS